MEKLRPANAGVAMGKCGVGRRIYGDLVNANAKGIGPITRAVLDSRVDEDIWHVEGYKYQWTVSK